MVATWETYFSYRNVVTGWMKVIQCLLNGRLQVVCLESKCVIL